MSDHEALDIPALVSPIHRKFDYAQKAAIVLL
jgi:hypothetical protein